MLKIITLVILILFMLFAGYLGIRNHRYISRVEEIQYKLTETSHSDRQFSHELIQDLPEKAAQYLSHAIRPGTILAEGVELHMKGTIKTSPTAEWMSFEARQYIKLGTGFVWRPEIKVNNLMRLYGADYYYHGDARVYFTLWGLIPVVNAAGEDISQSAAGRYLIESIWLPTQFLPSSGAEWKTGTDSTAEVSLFADDFRTPITLQLGKNGSLRSITALRFQDSSRQMVPFGGIIEDEENFGGYVIPRKVRVGWFFGTDDYAEFFRAEILDAGFY